MTSIGITRTNSKDEEEVPVWLLEENDDKIRLPIINSSKKSESGKAKDNSVGFTTTEIDHGDDDEDDEEEGGLGSSSSSAPDAGTTNTAKKTTNNKNRHNHKKNKLRTVPERQPLLADRDASAGDDFSSVHSKTAAEAKPHVPPQNPCLWIFHFLEGVAVISSLCLFLTQLIPLVIVPLNNISIMQWALRLYNAFFCVLIVITEIGLPFPLLRNSPLLQTYFSRGILYSFLGLVCVDEAYSDRVRDMMEHESESFRVGWESVFMQLSSWFMLGVGLVYVLFGVCCLKRVRDRMKEEENEAWRQYRQDLKAWKDKYGE